MHTTFKKSIMTSSDRVGRPVASGSPSRKLNVRAGLSSTPATVTVVIPCFNYARYLPDAVDSALAQQGADVEVIIVDDKSTDDSLAVARRLAGADRRITVLAHETNTGPVQTFNDGLALARGEFLVRLDADDLLTPSAFKRALAVMQRFPTVGLVYGHPIHFIDGERPAHRNIATSWTIWPGRDWLEACCKKGFNVITSPEVLMRRSVIDEVGGQMPLAHTHDMEMWLRIAAFSDIAYIHGADQAWHREHPKSLSAREVTAFRDLIERKDAFDLLFQGKAARIPQARSFHAKANAALAADAIRLAITQYDRGAPQDREIEMLRDVARALVADVEAVPGWAGLECRMAMGAERARRHPRYVLERIIRGFRSRYSHWKWHRAGEW
ncbi:MAG TPA: glycosyltransferase family A protein [Rhizobiaceae bacterium]|nr:glycosyltransferase family A protein [Rhizobiaceae bacterium]